MYQIVGQALAAFRRRFARPELRLNPPQRPRPLPEPAYRAGQAPARGCRGSARPAAAPVGAPPSIATCPLTMTALASRIGLEDAGAVMTEPFSQWVIEDRFAGPRPRWEHVGAELVSDVAPYETAKLRMLNGAHSLLAYCGLARGHQFVHQAIADPELHDLTEQLMLAEAAPTIAAAPGQDLALYARNLIARFANPALNHRLIQIAMDGSQKLPQRWLETLAARQAQGHQCPAILAGLHAWILHLRGANGPVDDPRAAELVPLANSANPLAALVGVNGLLDSAWLPD